MSTNSKNSPLIYIISTVVVIFIAAIIYKNSSVDNAEQITAPKVTVVTAPKQNIDKKEYDFTSTSVIPAAPTDEDPYAHLTYAERDELVSKKLNKYTLYRTPEQVMEVIYKLKELGREKEAEEYIDFLIKRFPDYEMN